MKDLPGEPKQLFNQSKLTEKIRDEIHRRTLTMSQVSREIGVDRSHFYQCLYGRPIQSVELYLRLVRWLRMSRWQPAPSAEETAARIKRRSRRKLSAKGEQFYTRADTTKER